MARAPKVYEKFTVTIESLDQEGRGVAHRDGKAVFVEGALPNETVVYERIRNKPSYESGRVVEVLKESSLRVKPACPHFGIEPGCCGGCAMQHLEPNAQVAIKQRVMLDALWHIGKVKPETIMAPIFGPFWGYRHRARLTVRDVAKKGGVLVGFHEKSSSYVADMTTCKILPNYVSELLVPLRELVEKLSIRQRLPQIEVAVGGDGRIALVMRVLETPSEEDLRQFDAFALEHGVDIWLQPKGPDSCYPMHKDALTALKLELTEFGVFISFKPTDFTQVNHRLNETMVSRAINLL
ncbi:MAG: TRAM domain-containing protein, partial [Burkholderiaceae bacterium]|nr:TRAM domain-containing protein [Burkholderiaceae bacterium]